MGFTNPYAAFGSGDRRVYAHSKGDQGEKMSAVEGAVTIDRHGDPAPITRMFGWAILGALAGFLINNVLNVGFGFSLPQRLFAGDTSALVTMLVLLVGIVLGAGYALRTPNNALRWDAQRIHRFNAYLIRGIFFGILFVGLADTAISFMRVEKVFDTIFAREIVLLFQRPDYVALYFHLPLLAFGFVIAAFTRTPGFHWLALLIILAELSIVITRFVFSYEQAFMGDLVRYWYSGLFLLASALTLHEEGHVRVDILYAGLSAKKKGLFNVIGILFLGMPAMWTILAVGFAGPQSIINSPVMNFEITQTGGIGMYVKYQMAAFLGVFGATMLIQFVVMLFDSVADWRDEPGHRSYDKSAQ